MLLKGAVNDNILKGLPETMVRPIQFALLVTRPGTRPQRPMSCKAIQYRLEGRPLALAKIAPRCTGHGTTKWALEAQ